MLRALLITLFFSLSLTAACSTPFLTCKQKIKDSHAIENNHLSLLLKGGVRLVYSKSKPHDALRYDPLLGLALVKDRSGFRYPFVFSQRKNKSSAVVSNTRADSGTILSHQCGLDVLAHYSHPYESPALLLDSCCGFEGIATPRGIIEERYVQHFIDNKFAGYGDAGFEIDESKKGIVVTQTNPFFPNEPLHKGDVIIAMDAKTYTSKCALEEALLFSAPSTLHDFKIIRDNQLLHVSVKLEMKRAGGLLSSSYLEYVGIILDPTLRIASIQPQAEHFGLKIGDQLKWVNRTDVAHYKEIRAALHQSNENLLLFERNHFQFFIRIQTKKD